MLLQSVKLTNAGLAVSAISNNVRGNITVFGSLINTVTRNHKINSKINYSFSICSFSSMRIQTRYFSSVVSYFPVSNVLPTTFPLYFPEWFAGTIDGDGYFVRPKASLSRSSDYKVTGLEIAMELKDLPLLQYIQKTLNCGSISPGGHFDERAYRFQIQNKEAIIIVDNCVNGHIRNSVRLPQFIEVCKRLDIVVKNPTSLTKDSYYFAGYFDADGCVSFSFFKFFKFAKFF